LRLKGLKWIPSRPLRLVSSISVRLAAGFALLTFAGVFAADKPLFQAKPVDQYANKQTADGVTIAAEAFTTDDQAKTAFGKLNPWRYNILPVLVVIRNDSSAAVSLEKMRFEYELPDHSRADAIQASDVKYSQGPNRPKMAVGPLGGVKVSGGKNPLNVPEIEVRAFAAKMLPPGESASGFVYFETDVSSAGAALYVTGLKNAATGKDLYYFDIPLAGK
jgi:hypothetical protein